MKKIVIAILIGISSLVMVGCNKEDTNKVEEMSLKEKVNQMLFITIPYTIENGEVVSFQKMNEGTDKFLKDNKPGGIILFQSNMNDYEQTKKLTDDIKKSVGDKVFIGVDEEGGIVHKIPNKKNTPNAIDIGKTGDPNEAYKVAEYIGGELNKLGINTDFAPDMDVNTNPDNPVIGDRSFSAHPQEVAEFGNKFIDGLHSKNILATTKHFPGHGDTQNDSHLGLVEVNHDMNRLEQVELYPFKEAINNNVDMVMVGHIIVPALDSSKAPASLSKPMVTDLLKGKMKFEGVVITDAMNMGAIADNYTVEEACINAINSGIDMVLMPNINIVTGKDVREYETLVDNICKAVEDGRISVDRIDDAISRINKLKEKL